MKLKHLVAIIAVVFAASTYAASSDMGSGTGASPGYGTGSSAAPKDDGKSATRHGSGKSTSGKSSMKKRLHGKKGTDTGTEGPGSSSKNKE